MVSSMARLMRSVSPVGCLRSINTTLFSPFTRAKVFRSSNVSTTFAMSCTVTFPPRLFVRTIAFWISSRLVKSSCVRTRNSWRLLLSVPAGEIAVIGEQRARQHGKRDLIGVEPVWIGENVNLPFPDAQEENVRDAGDFEDLIF